jgi:hypothetical protein
VFERQYAPRIVWGLRLQWADVGRPLFSTDDRTTMRHETLSLIVGEISAEMMKAKQARDHHDYALGETDVGAMRAASHHSRGG